MSTGRLITTAALLIALMAVLAVPALSGAKNSYTDPFSPAGVCQGAGFSHKHAKHKASPYATCVKTMKSLKKHKRVKVKTACKHYSHKHKRHHLSSYQRCLKAGKALRGH